jgi:hypothetical protein
MHGDGVARLGEIGGTLDGPQRRSNRARGGILAGDGDMPLGGMQRHRWH